MLPHGKNGLLDVLKKIQDLDKEGRQGAGQGGGQGGGFPGFSLEMSTNTRFPASGKQRVVV